MKTKSFFLSNLLRITFLLVLIFSISTNQAQSWKNLKKKFKETIEKVKNDPQVKKITEKLDPTDYIVKQINKNTNLDNYYYNINSKFKQIDYYLNQNTTLYNFQPGLYQKSFIKAKYSPEAGKILMYDNSLIYNIPVSIDNQKFNLFQSNDQSLYIESIDKSFSPVGEKLKNIILISYYTKEIGTLNSSFLKNLKGFSNAQAETYEALLIFYDKAVQSFDTLLNLSYAGVSANDVLSSYFKLMKLGYSYSGFETKIRNFRDELKTSQRLSLEVSQSAGDILSTMNKMKNNQNLSVAEINYAIQGFKKTAQSTNILADEMYEKYESLKKVQKQFARLSNFYGIFFIESIGSLYGKLGDYIFKIENKTRDYSNQLNSFVNEIEIASVDMYDVSYKKLTENMLKQYQLEHDIVNNLTTLNNDILRAKWYKTLNFPFNANTFIINLQKEDSYTIEAIKTDIYLFRKSKDNVARMIDTIPIKDFEVFNKVILTKINDYYLVGSLNVEEAYKPFQKIFSALKKNKMNSVLYSDLVKENKKITKYYKDAKRSNLLLYLLISVVFALIIAVIVFFIRRKRKKKDVLPIDIKSN